MGEVVEGAVGAGQGCREGVVVGAGVAGAPMAGGAAAGLIGSGALLVAA
ncbi:MAG: hypothetical protein HOV83_36930 [Catenulispora sp.]|nr:hypothetical protein [Catenulispora sp.]